MLVTLKRALKTPLMQKGNVHYGADGHTKLLDKEGVALLILQLPDGRYGGQSLNPVGLIREKNTDNINIHTNTNIDK